MKKDSIKQAYRSSKNIYDDTLTQAKWWSKLYIRFFWGGVDDIKIADRVLQNIPEKFSGKLLDVPVGTGIFTLNRYKTIPEAEITCLDYSEDMLQQARERFSEAGLKNIKCLQGDVGNLPFRPESFDLVLSMNGFHAFPDKERAFSETARVLKTGGVFLGCFYIRGQFRRTDFIVNTLLARKGWFTPPFPTLEELRAKLSGIYSLVEIQNEKSIVFFRCVK